MDKVYVFGHKNPDTDSVCGAISLSYLKNKLGFNTEPRILGNINDETKYALNYFNFDIPKYLNDVKVRIKDIYYHKDYYINEKTSIYETYKFMSDKDITGIPIVDDDNNFVGYVSLKEIAKTMISDNNNYLDTTIDNIIKTLNATIITNFDYNINGNIVAATFDDNTFIDKIQLDSSSILILGDRRSIIDYAINSNVKLIILIGNSKLKKDEIDKAKINKINVISTPLTSFETSKLLGLTNKINTIKRSENCICLDSDDYMSDFIEISNRTKHTNYPIVNKKGICQGMLRLIDINEYIKKDVILVDHNAIKQSVDGLEEANILEIIDHHNIGDITKIPIDYRIMSVGSVNTIIYYLYKENNIDIPNNIAGIMLCGILSDTILLNSPTTTIQDRCVVTDLSSIINVDYKDFGMDLIKSGMTYKNKNIEEIIYSDYKTFSVNDYKFSIGQVLTVDFNEFKDNIDEYVESLNEISNKNGYILSALYITDILTNKSMIIYNSNASYIIKDAHDLNDIYEGIVIDGLLSRKKQIVPIIMDVLEKN